MDAPQVPYLTIYIADGPDGAKEIFVDEDGPNCGSSGTRFKNLESMVACVRTWVADQVREATGQFDYNKADDERKMAVLRANLDEAFSPLLALQKPPTQETLKVIVNMPAGAAEKLSKMAGLFPEGHLHLWPLSIRSIEPIKEDDA